MLELRRARPVLRHARPVIRPRLVAVGARADHGLDSEAHARLRGADGLVLGVVRDVGRAVEEGVDAVAAVGGDDGALVGLGVLFDRVADVAEGEAGLDGLDGEAQALARRFHEVDVRGVEGRRADVVGFVEVAVVAVVVEGDVEVEDVAVEEDAGVGDAVADDFVGGGADGFGEVHVVEGGRVGLKG